MAPFLQLPFCGSDSRLEVGKGVSDRERSEINATEKAMVGRSVYKQALHHPTVFILSHASMKGQIRSQSTFPGYGDGLLPQVCTYEASSAVFQVVSDLLY